MDKMVMAHTHQCVHYYRFIRVRVGKCESFMQFIGSDLSENINLTASEFRTPNI